MTSILWFDLESFSECDLKTHGTHRYAEDKSTEITVAQWAFGEDEPSVVDCTDPAQITERLGITQILLDIENGGYPGLFIVAHNSHFDRTMLRHVWGIDIPPERWLDSMVKSYAHSMPGALGRVGEVMQLEQDKLKDDRGTRLIQMFCKPTPKGHKLRRMTRETHPKEWAEFLEYSRQDIPAMRSVDQALPNWNFKPGHSELDLWHLDQRINDRGFAVDVPLARAAIEAVEVEQKRLRGRVQEETDGIVSSASKRDLLLGYILAEYGVNLPDFKADTLRRRMEDPELPEGVKLLLAIRLEATKTSTAKYKALVNAVSADGRLRNTLQFGGAQRTTRWSGRIFQPQNMPRPNMEADDIDVGIQALLAGCPRLFFDDVMQLTANAVRGCIVAPINRKLCIADLSNIEGRVLAWLGGEQWKLDAFARYDNGDGPDLYIMAYARAFNVDPATVQKWMRQIGKVMELGLGYEGGVAAFLTFAAVYNMDIEAMADAVWETASQEALDNANGMWEWAKKKHRTLGLSNHVYVACEVLKRAWRDAHPATTALWADVADATRMAIAKPGQVFRVRDLSFRRDGSWLRVRLPSGRYLCYFQPKLLDDGQITYMGVDQYTRQWKRIKTYGGKLVENITQAVARDVLASAMQPAEDAGYEIVLSVHDELLTETPDTDEFSSDGLAAIMSTNPPWAQGLPLSAAGFETDRYRKD